MEKIRLLGKLKQIKIKGELNFIDLCARIESKLDNCFFLESLGEGAEESRFSLIGFDPAQVIREGENNVRYADLIDMMPKKKSFQEYAGGLVGYMGFDLFSYFEPTLNIKRHPKFDRFLFGVYTDGLIFDKNTGETVYYYHTKNRLTFVEKCLMSTKILKKEPLAIKRLGYSMTKTQYKERFTKIKKEIFAGTIFQCVFGFQAEYELSGDTFEIYKRLRKINPSPHMYYLKFGEQKIIGASPELLLRIKDDNMETYPLAGTIRRGKNRSEDKKFAELLLSDPKEIAEHKMLVDLHRNDMGRVATFGTMSVNKSMEIKKLSHVQHISSGVAGTLSDIQSMFSALASCFPAGTLAGAPKIEAVRVSQEMENAIRGPYGGAVGYFGFNQNCEFSIPIRTVFISGTYAFTQAGSGIVADSIAENEYEEVKLKLKAMEEALS